MNNKKIIITTIELLVCLLLVAIAVPGCKCCQKSQKSMAMESKQAACPICGRPLDKNYSTAYVDKTVCFFSTACKAEFEKTRISTTTSCRNFSPLRCQGVCRELVTD